MTPKIVAVIPARGGSKGILKKNLSLLCGKPLIYYAIKIGLACSAIDRVIVSTDDDEIARVAMEFGAEVPFIRPDQFAQDDTPDRPVFIHTIDWLREHEDYTFDYLINLRCTTPLKRIEHIEKAIEILKTHDCDSIRTADRIQGKHHPYWMLKRDDNGIAQSFIDGIRRTDYYRRQLLPPAYSINALVDIIKTDVILNNENLYGNKMMLLETDPIYSIDIDNPKDLIICEAVMEKLNEMV